MPQTATSRSRPFGAATHSAAGATAAAPAPAPWAGSACAGAGAQRRPRPRAPTPYLGWPSTVASAGSIERGVRVAAACDQVASRLYKMQARCEFRSFNPRRGATLPASKWLAPLVRLCGGLSRARAERLGGLLHAEVRRLAERDKHRDASTTSSSCWRSSCSSPWRASSCTRSGRSGRTSTRWPLQIHGNTRLELGLTLSAAADPGDHRDRHVHQAPRDRQPAELRRQRELGAVGVADRAEPAERAEADDLRDRPPVHLALHVRRRTATRRPGWTSFRTPTRRWSSPRVRPSTC